VNESNPRPRFKVMSKFALPTPQSQIEHVLISHKS